MKKLLTAIACLALCLSLAACTGSPSGSQDSTQSQRPGTSTGSQTEAPSVAKEIESYIAKSQKEIDALSSTLKNSGMELRVTARDKSLVYSYQYANLSGSDQLKSTLDKALEATGSSFETVLASLKQSVKATESVIVEYLDKDGAVITYKEFK